MNRKKRTTNMKSVFKRNTPSSVNQVESSTLTNQYQSAPVCQKEDDTVSCQQSTSMNAQEDNTAMHPDLCISDNKHVTGIDNRTAPDSVVKSRDTDSINTKERPYQSFSVVCAKELVRKVKAIARKEGLHVNAVVQAMYEEGIRRYEERHGALDAEPQNKNAREILFAT